MDDSLAMEMYQCIEDMENDNLRVRLAQRALRNAIEKIPIFAIWKNKGRTIFSLHDIFELNDGAVT
jgi:hypothetical protein